MSNDHNHKVLILFYSFSGNTAALAREVAVGAKSVAKSDVRIMQIPEYLTPDFFADKPELKTIRDSFNEEFPIATIEDLVTADGVAIGTPTHFGGIAAQVKVFIDQLTPAWLKGKLVNKPVAFFTSAGSMHGGEEAALLSMIPVVMNLGMLPIGIPYPIQGAGSDFDAGSPYGAIYVASRGSKGLSDADKKVARILGVRLATITGVLSHGCTTSGVCQHLADDIL